MIKIAVIESMACTADGKALLIKQFTYPANQQHFMMLREIGDAEKVLQPVLVQVHELYEPVAADIGGGDVPGGR